MVHLLPGSRSLSAVDDGRLTVSPWPFWRRRPQTVKRWFPSGFRGLEVARERGRPRVPDGPQGGFSQVGARLDPGELR